MLFSRPTRYIALGSCIVHILALGLAAAVQLTAAQPPVSLVKVALRFQQAVPLPMGNPGASGVGTPPPVPEPTPAATPPPPKPMPKAKPRTPPPATSRPQPQPRPQPAVIAPATPVEKPPLPAWPSVTWSEEREREGDPETVGGGVGASGGKGASGSKAGTGVGGGSGHGGGGGTSAHPDYGVNPKPPYPMVARRMGMQGVVVLRVHVRADGSVAEAELAQSSGSQLLDDSALKTVREQWRFLPARLDGEPVESYVEVPIRFVLDAS